MIRDLLWQQEVKKRGYRRHCHCHNALCHGSTTTEQLPTTDMLLHHENKHQLHPFTKGCLLQSSYQLHTIFKNGRMRRGDSKMDGDSGGVMMVVAHSHRGPKSSRGAVMGN